MKKFLSVIFTALSILIVLTNTSFAAKWGKGELKMSEQTVDVFIEYIKGKHTKAPHLFAISKDGLQYQYYYCSAGLGNCQGGDAFIIEECNKYSEQYANGVECALFSRNRTIKWKNGINKNTKINSKWSDEDIRAKLTELGFLGAESESFVTKKTEKKKEEKKTEKKVTSTTVSGERALALNWEGYEDLIAGTIKFSENNNKGNIKLTLPNNDGSCEGSYSLQESGKGTWQIACTNNMGAAGTLKWGDSGTTGIGRDYKDKKVKFTVAEKS